MRRIFPSHALIAARSGRVVDIVIKSTAMVSDLASQSRPLRCSVRVFWHRRIVPFATRLRFCVSVSGLGWRWRLAAVGFVGFCVKAGDVGELGTAVELRQPSSNVFGNHASIVWQRVVMRVLCRAWIML
jgi:hypothetical protein